MERPYVIYHILSSLDGKITGPFMGTEAVGALAAAYGKYRTEINADAVPCGREAGRVSVKRGGKNRGRRIETELSA